MQNTTWIFQAARTRDRLFGIEFPAYMLQVVNPILVLISISLMERVINPYLKKHKLFKHPLKRMLLGGAIAGTAFFIAGCVEMNLEVIMSVEHYTLFITLEITRYHRVKRKILRTVYISLPFYTGVQLNINALSTPLCYRIMSTVLWPYQTLVGTSRAHNRVHVKYSHIHFRSLTY